MYTKNELSGIGFKTISIFLTAIGAILDKSLVMKLAPFQTFFMASSGCLIVLTFVLKCGRQPLLSFIKDIDRTYFYSATLSFVTLCSYLWAVRQIDLNIVTALTFMKPLFVTFFAVALLSEKTTFKCVAALILGTIGAYITIRQPEISGWKVAFAFVPPIGWALYDVVNKRQATKDHWTKQAFLTVLLTTVIACPFGISTWQPLTEKQWLSFLLIGVLSVVGKICYLNALSRAQLVVLAPIDFIRLVFVAILTYWVFDVAIALSTIFGGILIVIATGLITHHVSTRRA